MLERKGDMDILAPLCMGVVSPVEFFVRGGDSCGRAKPPASFHRPTEDGFEYRGDRILKVVQ